MSLDPMEPAQSRAVSIIIPVRNEEAEIEATLQAAIAAAERSRAGNVEIIVVDNLSEDATASKVQALQSGFPIALLPCAKLKAPCARNHGATAASGDVLVFVDADTRIPPDAVESVLAHLDQGREAGIFGLESIEPGAKARLWWMFWDHVRRLPMARAKAMPAFMFCTRRVFDQYGPFDETVVLGEEWPILAEMWRRERTRFVYDRSLRGRSSSRRMELQRFGYTRTLLKYVWAILHASGRRRYSDRFRRPAADPVNTLIESEG